MSLPSMSVTAPKLLTAVLKYELFPDYCRGEGTLLAGSGGKRTINVGRVLGKITGVLEAASAAKTGGNTGDGTFVLDNTTPVLALAAPGVYKLRFVTTTSIRLEAPDGTVLGDTAIGGSTGNSATIAERIKGAMTQGATPFAAGDGFDITVAHDADSDDIGKIAEFDEDNNDGTQTPFAIALVQTTAPDGVDVPIVYLERGPAIVSKSQIEWSSGITDDEKLAAIAVLEAKGIIFRND